MASLKTQLNNLVFVVLSLSLFELGCLGKEQVKGYPPSVNCATRECFSYEVIHSQKEFEIRDYKLSEWVTGPYNYSTNNNYVADFRKAYLLLSNYFNGNNIPRRTLKMGLPILADAGNPIEVYFRLPQTKDNFPAPHPEQNITKVGLPMLRYGAVRRFDGYLNDTTITAEQAALVKSLQGTQWQNITEYPLGPSPIVADYNLPGQIKGRVNEIILAFGDPWPHQE